MAPQEKSLATPALEIQFFILFHFSTRKNYEELKSQHVADNLFVDPWFPASALSINVP